MAIIVYTIPMTIEALDPRDQALRYHMEYGGKVRLVGDTTGNEAEHRLDSVQVNAM